MSPLIEITELDLLNGETILIDARGGADAHERYLNGHLPKAVFASLDDDLAAHPVDPAYGGRHPLPSLHTFSQTLKLWGVTPLSRIVVYDDKNGAMSAARLWWMLRSIGHKQVQVLNGGLKAAIEAGIDLETGEYQAIPADHAYPMPDEYEGAVTIDDVVLAAHDPEKLIIDVRDHDRYLGRTEPLDLIAGHIPGAVNLPFGESLDASGKYKPSQELNKKYCDLFGDVEPGEVIVHCGSGVTAAHTLLGMEYAGLPEPKMYVGSWSEWSRRDLPIATEERG